MSVWPKPPKTDIKQIDFANQASPVVLEITSGWTKEPNNSDLPPTASDAQATLWNSEQEALAKQSKQDLNLDYNFDTNSDQCIQLIGGLDISFAPKNKIDCVVCLTVIHYPSKKLVFEAYKMAKLSTPYKAGFLDFREVPLYMDLLEEVYTNHPEYMPQLLMVDGNGTLQHRFCGAAVHLGVKTGIPSLGVAKTLLCVHGINSDMVDTGFEDLNARTVELISPKNGRHLATAVRRAPGDPKFYISPGHGINMQQAVTAALETMNAPAEGPLAVELADDLGRRYLKRTYTPMKK